LRSDWTFTESIAGQEISWNLSSFEQKTSKGLGLDNQFNGSCLKNFAENFDHIFIGKWVH